MPPTLHKSLIHGAKIIDHCILPIGQLSEEVQEASNKYFKKARLNNSRTCTRLANNEDVMHHLMISSDPLISSLRQKEKESRRDFNVQAISLLKT